MLVKSRANPPIVFEPVYSVCRLVPSVFAFFTEDFNQDGTTDILTAGNFYGVLPYEGRYDAGFGNVSLVTTSHGFNTLSPIQSGFIASGEVRDIKQIKLADGRKCLIVARNNNSPLFFTW